MFPFIPHRHTLKRCAEEMREEKEEEERESSEPTCNKHQLGHNETTPLHRLTFPLSIVSLHLALPFLPAITVPSSSLSFSLLVPLSVLTCLLPPSLPSFSVSHSFLFPSFYFAFIFLSFSLPYLLLRLSSYMVTPGPGSSLSFPHLPLSILSTPHSPSPHVSLFLSTLLSSSLPPLLTLLP